MTFAYSPFNFYFIPFLSLTALLYATATAATAKQAAFHGFYFGLGWFGAGISWVHIAIADFGGLPIILSLALMLLLVSYLALFPMLATWLTVKLKNSVGLFAFVISWIFSEWLRSWMLTGFPWLSIGYTQTSSPLSGFAPIIGEFGLQVLVLLLVISLLAKRKLLPLLSIVFCFTLGHLLQMQSWALNTVIDSTQSPSSKTANISLVQGNIAQSVKWQPDNEVPTMTTYAELTQSLWSHSDIVIWPEAAIPRLEVLARDYLNEMDRTAAESNTALLTGIVDFQPDTQLAYNNIIALGKKQADAEFGHYKYLHHNRYNKHHLLPIGEFVPFESILRTLAPIFDLPMSSFSRGQYQQENLVANGLNITPAICFEIAFSNQLRANVYQDSDFILTVSNDAWFGDSHGPWQHLQIAQMRALEFAKPVVRVTNNGITAFISSNGEIAEKLPQNQAGTLSKTLTLTPTNTPFYRFGYIPTFAFLLFATLLAFALNRQQSRSYF
ncbi:MAG: apolipoprotein N-acyltransferase [Gammaproteobacteria bacterium]|nr:apolipoprotein N-acyltransferase [Gammaproteobacteria bacterium]